MPDSGIHEAICSLSLVDEDWYSQVHALSDNQSPLAHFLMEGWRKRLAPSPFFNPHWYTTTYHDVAAAGMDPLSHYINHGESEGRWPCRILDPLWYAQCNDIAPGRGRVLAHYQHQGSAAGLRPNAIFDPKLYAGKHCDLPSDLRLAAIHYIDSGFREFRFVSDEFDAAWYRRTFLGTFEVDPVHHYLTIGAAHGYAPQPRKLAISRSSVLVPRLNRDGASNGLETSADEVRRVVARGPDFEERNPYLITGRLPKAKVIAFYLPQFHAIPENDEWWGPGFTEWTNVCRGQPRFVGHYQPRVPRDLGFYDLISDPSVMRRQIEMARSAGIHGFCFYYYQFGNRRLLEKPLQRLLADPSLDFPFCLMWANENWTRRWDGQEREVLIEHSYKDEDDEYLTAGMAAAMKDARYIRIDGRPLVIIYRPGVIPNVQQRVTQWRKLFREIHNVEPWIFMAQAFHDHDPTDYGLDGAVEFPPHKLTTRVTPITDHVSILDPAFDGAVFDYNDIVTASLEDPEPPFTLFKTAFPSWDNDARRQGSGTSVTNSTPQAYRRWMEGLIERARRHRFGGEAMVFVNAWNEWAEAAYLEPDLHYGFAYLNATARAIVGDISTDGKPELLLVGHDAHEHGAQMTLLNLGRAFTQNFGLKVTFLLLGAGALEAKYREIGEIAYCSPTNPDFSAVVEQYRDRGIRLALTNTVITGSVVPYLKQVGIQVISLVHELPKLMRDYSAEGDARQIARESDVVVFPAEVVRNAFEAAIAPVVGETIIRPQGLYANLGDDPGSRADVRKELGLEPNARIVVGLGYGDLRKGTDLFVETACLSNDPGLVFVWIGRLEQGIATWLERLENKDLFPKNFRHLSFTPAIARYLYAADLLYLTSREDPFPSTVLEALACGLPVVGFAGCSGTESLICRHGAIVPAFDKNEALAAIVEVIDARTPEHNLARKAAIASHFRWDDYAMCLLQSLNPTWKAVSVVVPNYNYARHLRQRLTSIFEQTIPIYEIIVLDDASTDESLEVIDQVARESGRVIRLIKNEQNSGSVLRQWLHGAREASGEYVWIAEADDIAKPTFLAELLSRSGPNVQMAFCDSIPVDDNGQQLGTSYNPYLSQYFGRSFEADMTIGSEAYARRFLSTLNSILNVSSVLFRREALLDILEPNVEELASYRFAGDWLTYLKISRQPGEIAYCAKPLNVHRRHQQSVTHSTLGAAHLAEIERIHQAFSAVFGTTPEIAERQRAYLDELQEQFGLREGSNRVFLQAAK